MMFWARIWCMDVIRVSEVDCSAVDEHLSLRKLKNVFLHVSMCAYGKHLENVCRIVISKERTREGESRDKDRNKIR